MDLAKIFQVFNTSLNGEQIWAVCYQYTKKFIADRTSEGYAKGYPIATDLESVFVNKDGEISVIGEKLESSDRALIDAFGRVLFEASDYRTDLNDENAIGPDLERLIERMTVAYDGILSEEDDEGYEDYEEEHHSLDHGPCTWEIVLKICAEHLDKPSKANEHYLAVCRALITEAVDLKSFLEKVSSAGESLVSVANLNNNNDALDGSESDEFPALNFTEWAHLWIQVVSDLRVGVKLKRVDGYQRNHEFELTPYEILMEDIRQRNYRLRKVAINGEITSTICRNPHDVILQFIKSRPTLKPIQNRILGPPPPRSKSLHELLLEQIQEPPSPLRHVQLPEESPLPRRIDISKYGKYNAMKPARSCDDMLNGKRDKRRLNAPPYAAELGVAVSSTELRESDTTSEEYGVSSSTDSDDSDSSFAVDLMTTDDVMESTFNDESVATPFQRHSASSNSCSLRSSGTSGVSSGGGDEHELNGEKNASFQRKTSTVRQKKVLLVDIPSSPIAESPMDCSACEETKYTKISSRGGGVKRAHTFSTKSMAQPYQPYSVRPSWRDLRAKAARKAAETFAEKEESIPLPPSIVPSSSLRNIYEDSKRTHIQSSRIRQSEYIHTQRWRDHEREQCVSITTDELFAIRKKLVAHDLEQFQDRGQLYSSLKKGKICFNCRVREFNIFWWARNCQICEQRICSKCMRKVDAPFGKKLYTPVRDLRPCFDMDHDSRMRSWTGDQPATNSRLFGPSLSVLRERTNEESILATTPVSKKMHSSESPTKKIRKMDVCEACESLLVRVLTVNAEDLKTNEQPVSSFLKRSSSSVGAFRPTKTTISRSNTSVGNASMQAIRTIGKNRALET